MEIERFDIEGPLVVTPRAFGDARGSFCVTYVEKDWRAAGVDVGFVQDNQSISVDPGVVRGLHLQAPPYAQDKLVRVIRGRVLDVIVDVRSGSPTFGQHIAVELSAENRKQFFVPVGFAHGFATLEPMTEVHYKVSAYYAPGDRRRRHLERPGSRHRLADRRGRRDAFGKGQGVAAFEGFPNAVHLSRGGRVT